MNRELSKKLGHATGRAFEECDNVLKSMSDELAQRYVQYFQENPGSCFIDPQEVDPLLKKVFKDVDTEVSIYMENWKKKQINKSQASSGGYFTLRGSCHVAWREKQRILKQKYGINWLSPAKMNPGVKYD